VARSSTTSVVFNAIAEVRRREILDTRGETGEVPGAGAHRLYSLEPARMRPLHEWLARCEQMWNERLDRIDDFHNELQKRECSSDT
jgi:hypothetical protein